MKQRALSPRHQGGASLIIGLLVLVILTFLGLAAMQTSVIQERMVGNLQDHTLAREAAEAALRNAEEEIFRGDRISGATGFATDCNPSSASLKGLCLPASSGDPIWEAIDWSDAASPAPYIVYGGVVTATAWPNVATQPRYIVEVMLNLREVDLGVASYGNTNANKYQYRITAMGYGASATTRVMIQSVYRLP